MEKLADHVGLWGGVIGRFSHFNVFVEIRFF
jgi:hypothetical protein